MKIAVHVARAVFSAVGFLGFTIRSEIAIASAVGILSRCAPRIAVSVRSAWCFGCTVGIARAGFGGMRSGDLADTIHLVTRAMVAAASVMAGLARRAIGFSSPFKASVLIVVVAYYVTRS